MPRPSFEWYFPAMTEADKTFQTARALPEPHHATTHGVLSSVPIIRALLPNDEAEAWDRAPVPGNCPEMLEEVFREFCVLKFRVHKWEVDAEKAGDVAELQQRIRLLYGPLRGLLKAVEVHARIIEVEHGAEMSDAVTQHLRTLPSHQLESYIMEGESPRFHPGTGAPLALPAETRPGPEIDRGPEPEPTEPPVDLGTERYPLEVDREPDSADLPPWHPDRT